MKSQFMLSGPLSSDLGLLFLRIVSGAVMPTHGYPKFQKVLEGNLAFGDHDNSTWINKLLLFYLCNIL